MGITQTILSLHPAIVIFGFSFLVTLISILAYKFLTNQKEMKQLKLELKDHQKEMKQHRNNQKKLMEIQKKTMEKNLKYMKHSFKPMLFTFLPIILLFGWLHANIAYDPIIPGQEFDITFHTSDEFNISFMPEEKITTLDVKEMEKEVIYKLKGEKGAYTVFVESGGEQDTFEFVITDEQKYEGPEFKLKLDNVKLAEISNDKMKPFGDDFNIFGYFPGWFMTYFISAIIFNTIMRKLFKIY